MNTNYNYNNTTNFKNPITAIKDNFYSQINNISKIGGKMKDFVPRLLVIAGLFCAFFASHFSAYYIENESDTSSLSAFKYLGLGEFPFIIKLIYFVALILFWVFTVKCILNFTNYISPYKKFWKSAVLAYIMRILPNAFYYIIWIVNVSVIKSEAERYTGEYYEEYLEKMGLKTGFVFLFFFVLSIAGIIYTLVKKSKYKDDFKIKKARLNITANILGIPVNLEPAEFACNAYLDAVSGELYIKTGGALKRVSDNAIFDIVNSNTSYR